MTDKRIEEKVKKAFSDATPDILDSIIHDCTKADFAVPEVEFAKRKLPIYIKLGAVAAAFVAVVSVGTAASYFSENYRVVSKVSLDVNPSIEINVNKADKVIKAVAKNADAKNIVGDMELRGVPLDVALNALIGSMFNGGYLTPEQNTVLISVEADGNKSEELCKKLSETVETAVGENGEFEPSLVIQNISSDEKLKEYSEKYDISTGKASLIDGIVESDPEHYSFEELSELSVTELNIIIEGRNKKADNIENLGAKASVLAYIGSDKAIEIALLRAGVPTDAVDDLECELDVEKGVMVYEVEFNHIGSEYSFDINAVSGEVIFSEIEAGNNNVIPTETESNGQEEVQEIVPEEKPPQITEEVEPERTPEITPPEIKKPEKDPSDIPFRDPSGQPEKDKPEPIKPELITKERALEIALSHAKLSEGDIVLKKAEIDRDDGRISYEIEFNAGGIEYEYEIDAQNGNIIDSEREKDDDIERKDRNGKDFKGGKDTPFEKNRKDQKR